MNMSSLAKEFLTTRELADLLRIKERRVYDLVSSGEIPYSKATGKLLFPRKAIDKWLEHSGFGFEFLLKPDLPNIIVGSHDPLLQWALGESQSGMASLFDSSVDGLERFIRGEALATGMHILPEGSKNRNVALIKHEAVSRRSVLLNWVWRKRGLITRPENLKAVSSLNDLQGIRLIARQEGAGSQRLFGQLCAEENVPLKELEVSHIARSEVDAVLAVAEQKGDVCFGLESLAKQYNLAFTPLCRERYDLLVCRKVFFDVHFQKLVAFTGTELFQQKASSLGGYDLTEMWQVMYNG